MLRGDEVGVLLADHLMRRGVTGLYATTIVSSSLLRAMCAARGLPYAETLTGFKWIVRAGGGDAGLRLRGGARLLRRPGACPGQGRHHRRADRGRAGRRAEGGGSHAGRPAGRAGRRVRRAPTDQLSVRVDDLRVSPTRWPGSGRTPRPRCSGSRWTAVEDLLPEADVVILRTATARVVIRPSGTEPKLKAYLEVVEPVVDGDVPAARQRRGARAAGRRACARRGRRACPAGSERRRGRVQTGLGVPRRGLDGLAEGGDDQGDRRAGPPSRRVLTSPENPAPVAISSAGGGRRRRPRRAAASAAPSGAPRPGWPARRSARPGAAAPVSASASRCRVSASTAGSTIG